MLRYPKTFNNVTSTDNNPPYKPAPLLSDEEFYGTWDKAKSEWTKLGILNYAARSGLKPVEDAVKKGDYEAAGKALLAYYRARKDIELPTLPEVTDRSKLRAELFMDQVYMPGDLAPFYQFEVGAKAREFTFDVTEAARSGQGRFMLVSRNKGDASAFFNSREAATNKPTLRLTIAGKDRIVPASADTYLQFGAKNKGREATLIVRGSKPGVAIDKNTCKALLRFELNAIDVKRIENAALVLYGRTDALAGSMAVLLAPDRNSSLGEANEQTFGWDHVKHAWFSYQGLRGLKAWRNPGAGNHHTWFFVTAIVRFPSYPHIIAMYRKTGDEHYAKRAIQIYLDYVEYQMFNRLDSGVRTDTLIGPSMALYKSPSMTPQALKIMIEHAWRLGDWFFGQKQWYSNHNYGSSYIAGHSSISYQFPELRDAPKWWEQHHQRALIYTSKGVFGADHSFREGNTAYGCMILDFLNRYRGYAMKSGTPLPSKLVTNFRGIARYAMDVSDPSGVVFPYGDTSNPHRYNPAIIRSIAEDHDDPELLFIATGGKQGKRPARTSVWYPDTKLAVMRTAWADENALSLFVNARNGGNHWHANTLSLVAYAYGNQMIDDTYHYPSVAPHFKGKETRYHNAVLADGLGQGEKGAAEGSMVINPAFDLFDGYTDAIKGFRHRRRILLVKPSKFWIVSDRLDAKSAPKESHTYTQTWHPRPGSGVALLDGSKAAVTSYPSRGNVMIVPADAGELGAGLADGWWSNDANKYVTYEKKTKGSATFDTVLYPMPEGKKAELSLKRLDLGAPTTTTTALELGIGARKAWYCLSYEKEVSKRTIAQFTTDARMFYFEQDDAGQPRVLTLEAGSLLRDENRAWVACATPVSDLGVIWDAEKKSLLITASDNTLPTTVKLYSPFSASHVLLNDKAIDFRQEGSIVIVQDRK